MKKLMLFAAAAVFSLTTMNAQDGELRAGLNGGATIGGDAKDFYGATFGLDVTYLFPVSDQFSVGGATGFQSIAGDEITIEGGTFFGVTVPDQTTDVDNFNYIPLAAAGRFNASEAFVIGADLGYAIATGEGDGGFYYAPVVAYNISEKFRQVFLTEELVLMDLLQQSM